MATKKFVTDRLAKIAADIEKKTNLISKMTSRIENNKSKLIKLGYTESQINDGYMKLSNNSVNFEKAYNLMYSIDNSIESIKNATVCLEELNQKKEKLEAELKTIIEKESSRDIKIIVDFLNVWKNNVKNFYKDCLPKWVEARRIYFEADHNYCEEFNHGNWRRTGDKTKLDELSDIRKKMKEKFQSWSFLNPYIVGHLDASLDYEKIQRDLDHEANMKYDFIIERTNKIVGQITDASHLSISEKGDLNGVIYGTRGIATVSTIDAGGYNIQCYHFRTLIREWKN